MEERIKGQVKKQMDRAQKEYYLNEKIRAIRGELGLSADQTDEVEEPEEEETPSRRKASSSSPPATRSAS